MILSFVTNIAYGVALFCTAAWYGMHRKPTSERSPRTMAILTLIIIACVAWIAAYYTNPH